MKPLPVLLFFLVAWFAAANIFSAEKKEEDNKPPYYLTDAQLDKALGIDEKVKAPKEYVWVVYFHRVPGCDTCQVMSKYIYETVKARFGDDVKDRKIVLRYRDLEDKKNADLIKKLGIKSPMLAVIQIKDGKMAKAKLADKIWSLAAEKKKFMDYVEKEIEAYTDKPTPSYKEVSFMTTTSNQIIVDYLYLDLDTCERCVATDEALKKSIEVLSGVFDVLGRQVTVNSVNISSKELAVKHRFVSSPTIRVNGVDICDEVKESDCTDCGDLCGDSVDCRVFVYEGKEYDQPPVAMIVDGILRVLYGQQSREDSAAYTLPDNLEKFFAGKSGGVNNCNSAQCCPQTTQSTKPAQCCPPPTQTTKSTQCCPPPTQAVECCPQSAQCCPQPTPPAPSTPLTQDRRSILRRR